MVTVEMAANKDGPKEGRVSNIYNQTNKRNSNDTKKILKGGSKKSGTRKRGKKERIGCLCVGDVPVIILCEAPSFSKKKMFLLLYSLVFFRVFFFLNKVIRPQCVEYICLCVFFFFCS